MLLIVVAVILSFGESKEFQLYYRNAGDGASHSIECGASATVGKLRQILIEAINAEEGFTISMSFGGRKLNDDDQTLADAAICSESVIDVSVRKILADGCYQFVSAHSDTVLVAPFNLWRDPQIFSVESVPPANYWHEYDVFCIEKQPCESYTVQCKNEAFWYLYLENGGTPTLCQRRDAEDIQLFDFVHDDDDKWLIKRKNNPDEAMTVIVGNCVQEMSLFDVHHQVSRLVSRDQQLFYCKRQGIFTRVKRASEISIDFLTVLLILILLLILDQFRF